MSDPAGTDLQAIKVEFIHIVVGDGGKLYGLCGLQSCYKLKEGVAENQAETEDDYEFIADENCQLDECNMAEKDGEMAYFFSDNWPYVPPCLKGQVSFINGGIYP